MNAPGSRLPLAVLLFLCGSAVRATPTYPGVTRDQLTLPRSPSCSLCHRGTPALGNATRPVAGSLIDFGLVPYNETTLRTAWDQLELASVDSDGDSIPDVEELLTGSDPNRDPSAPPEPPEPAYGCQSTGSPPLLIAAGWLVLTLGRRRHRGARTPN